MNKRPDLRCILAANHAFNDYSDVGFAVASLTKELLDDYLGYIRDLRAYIKKNKKMRGFLVADEAVTVYEMTDDWYEAEDDPDHPMHPIVNAVEKSRHGKGTDFLSSEVPISARSLWARHDLLLKIHPKKIWWAESTAPHDEGVYTGAISIEQLLLARIYYAMSQEEVDEFFRELVATAPSVAVTVLEQGIRVIGGETVRVMPTPDALLPLLTSSRHKLRMGAIAALGGQVADIGHSRVSKPKGRRS